MINFIIIGAILIYCIYVTRNYIEKSKKGKCSSCKSGETCITQPCKVNWDDVISKSQS